MSIISSKERILNAINHLSADHIPLWLLMIHLDRIKPFSWSNQVERVKNVLELGLDDTLLLQPPLVYVEAYDANKVPGVKSEVTVRQPGCNDQYPLITKEYFTKEGNMKQTVRKTDDWIYGNDVFLFSDYNVSRAKENILKCRDDIKKLKCLLADPDTTQMDKFKEEAGYLRKQAQSMGVALEGGWSALGDVPIWLCGMEEALIAQLEEPEYMDELLEVIFDWEIKRIELLLDEGVDIVVHMAWYEGMDFWTPDSYRSMIKPRLKKMIGMVHEKGAKFRYIITKGWKYLMDDFLEMGIDCISGVDPVQDNIKLEEVKKKIGERICLMGGVNSAVMFTQWSDEDIRGTVKEVMDIMSPGGGFILYPVDQIFHDTPWNKVEILIDTWKGYNLGL